MKSVDTRERLLTVTLSIVLMMISHQACDDPTIGDVNRLVQPRIRDAESVTRARDSDLDTSYTHSDQLDLGSTIDQRVTLYDEAISSADLSTSEPAGDGYVSDAQARDALIEIFDATSPLDQALDARPDLSTLDHSVPDLSMTTDAALGPVPPGNYVYSIIPSRVTDPPAVAWHPDGTYALVLNHKNTVHRYQDQTLTEIASEGDRVRWRDLAFTPDGDHAILLATHTSNEEGRIYLWDHQTQTLAEMSDQRFSQGRYEVIEYHSDGAQAKILGTKSNGVGYLAYLWDFQRDQGRTGLSAHATSARCEDLGWVRDISGFDTVAITCGHNGVDLYHIDSTGSWARHTMNAGNTSHISARPQGDYALAVTDTSHKLYRFEAGIWETDFSSPFLPASMNVEFSPDGRRAMIFGGLDPSRTEALIYEYRHDLYERSELSTIAISNLNASGPVYFNDVSWHPSCNQGLIVGGHESIGRQIGYVILFTVMNGDQCDER